MLKSNTVILVWTIFGLLAGLLSSCTLGAATITGRGDVAWANWQPLGAPPQKPDRIASVGAAIIGIRIVVGAGDKQYACCVSGPGNWREIAASNSGNLGYGGAPGSYIVNTPGDAVATASNVTCQVTCSVERHYVVRADGTVWTWGTSVTNSQEPPGLFLSQILWVLWTVAGLLTGVVLAGLAKIRRHPSRA